MFAVRRSLVKAFMLELFVRNLTAFDAVVCRITYAVIDVSQGSGAALELSVRIVGGIRVHALACVGCTLYFISGDASARTAVAPVVFAGLINSVKVRRY